MAKSNLKRKEENFINFSDLLIKKITMKDRRAIIEYSTDDDFKTNECKFKVKDEVNERFKGLWDRVKTIVTALTPQLYKEVAALDINSISFKYENGGYLDSVCIAATWNVDDNGHILNLNYNNYRLYREEFAEDYVAISGEHEQLLFNILSAAKSYMKGDTKASQMKLIVDNTEA